MLRNVKRATFAATGASALAASLLAGTASADSGSAEAFGVKARTPGVLFECGSLANLQDPTRATNVGTAVQASSLGGTAQVRYGRVNGVQYGWARSVNATAGTDIAFEIDITGDRRWDCATWEQNQGGSGTWYTWTTGTQTSSSSNVAFRACILPPGAGSCSNGGVAITSWW